MAAIKNAIPLNIQVISNKKDTLEQIFELQNVATLLTELVKMLTEEIKKHNVRNAETDTTKESINHLLCDTKFQGFQLQKRRALYIFIR